MARRRGNHDTMLMVGYVCYDLIFSAPQYPEEDSLSRSKEYQKRRGGNASNSCTVLSQLGAKCELLAPMTADEYAEFLQNDLHENGVLYDHCPRYPNYDTPFTTIILSESTGTRTIIYYRPDDYPENTAEDFQKLELSAYKWIHFEARTLIETLKMMDILDAWNAEEGNTPIPYSVELENGSEEAKDLIPRADVIFVSKDFAKYLGYDNPLSTVQGLATQIKAGAVIIVPWGAQGAMARCSNGEIVESAAYPPQAVIDSTGAGDTFIAATLFYLSKSKSVAESIDFGNLIAGAKCGMMGFHRINAIYKDYLKDCNQFNEKQRLS